MSEFLQLVPPSDARTILYSEMAWPLAGNELIPTADSLQRVTAEDIFAPHGLPEFARSTVDGYAVRSDDTFGASSSQPAYLRLAGEVAMGTSPTITVEAGTCVLMHTGGMLPDGADAVLMLEHASTDLQGGTAEKGAHEIEVLRAVAHAENVIAPGEDVRAGQVVIARGARLRAAEIGGLMALGLTTVLVKRRPVVALISSGDEVVNPSVKPEPGQVRDVNGPALAALVTEAGGTPRSYGIVPDRAGQAEQVARDALETSDVVVITAGSSASARDMTAQAITALGTPGVLLHGISIRPGKPTIIGVCSKKPVIGLPGNPVSALIVARLILAPLILKLLGAAEERPRPTVLARLSTNLASQAGREDWWPVRLRRAQGGPVAWDAEPIFGRSNLIFSLASADGVICIPAPKNGLEAGQIVEVESL